MFHTIAAVCIAAIGLVSFASLVRPAPPSIIAHRGASFDAPENTLAAFRLAWEQGADGIEGDFHLTADQEIVCLHDATFKRTAGVDRKVSEMTLAEIRALDVGSWKDSRFAGERVATLEEVLAMVPPDKLFFIEIKCGVEVMPRLKQVLETSKVPMAQLRLICFKAQVVAESKRLMPELKAYWLTSFKAEVENGPKKPDAAGVLATLKAINADGVDLRADMDVVDERFMTMLVESGYEVHAWTVDDAAIAQRLAEMGVTSITTNRPDLIRASLHVER